MKVKELIEQLEKMDEPEAEVYLITTDHRTVVSALLTATLEIPRKGARTVHLSDDQ